MITLLLLLTTTPDPIEGRWACTDGQLLTVGPAGALASHGGMRGKWSVDDASKRAYRFAWETGRRVDHVSLGADGLITGVNSMGGRVGGRRVGDRVLGAYAWSDHSVVTLGADGQATSTGGKRGRWTALDATLGRYRVSWDSSGDELELSPVEELGLLPDGMALLGPDGKVVGYRLAAPPVGTWIWSDGKETTLQADGSFDAFGPGSGAWRLIDASKRTLQLDWGAKQLDQLVLSADGLRLEGTSDFRGRITAMKKPDEVVGTWSWSDGRKVIVGADGSLRVNGKRGPWDRWLLVDARARRYGLAWDEGDRVEILTLSEDGLRLEGEDTRGAPVSGTRRKK